MKRIALFAAMIAILQFFFQGCTSQQDGQVVAEFGKNKITLDEFEKAYLKNAAQNKGTADSATQYDNFLDLYVKFRMKLEDAKGLKYDEIPELKNELSDYRKKVGITYILEKKLVEPNLRRLWEFRHYEMRLSHLMIRPDTSGDAAAKKRAQSILDSIKAGASFEDMVKKYSQDNYSKQTGGDIYYFTGGTFLPEFEEAFFVTPVGHVYPELVKTKYGYHILKVTEKRERIPEVHAAHILIDFQNEKGEVDTAASHRRADSVYKLITVDNKSFAEMAKKFSKDPGSKDNGGDLGFYPRRSMVKEFDELSFNLQPGEISKPFKTQYGYHILKLIARKPFPTFEEDKEAIKANYKQYRYQADYDTLTASMKKQYHCQIDTVLLQNLGKISDTIRTNATIFTAPAYSGLRGKTVITADGAVVPVDTLIAYIINSGEYASRYMSYSLYEAAAKKYTTDLVLELAAAKLETENPEFASLMEDYKDGIFIFKLQEDQIWSKISADSAKLVAYYEKNKEKFMWPDRLEFSEIFTRNDSILTVCQGLLDKGVSFDTVAAQYTERAGLKETAGRFELQDVNTSDLSREAAKMTKPGEVSAVFPNSGGKSIFKLIRKDPAHIKTYAEARAEVSGAYQEEESKRLEAEYLNSLDQKYKPVLHKDVLAKAFKH